MDPGTQRKPRQGRNIELVVAITLGALAVACFVGQIRSVGAHTTATEIFLFNSLQFILTAGFAWFSTRAVSRIEFEQSLKKFAISAYRRIADIERMVDRLQHEVREMISYVPRSEINNLRIVDAIVSDTGQLVRSSISDWGDVIGEELLAIEQIRRLEREKELLQKDESSAKVSPAMEELRKKIEDSIAMIQRTLPARLQLETEPGMGAGQLKRTAQWLFNEHRREDGLRMRIVTGDPYRAERSPKTLEPGEALATEKVADGGIDVIDKEGRGVGRLLNRTPLGYDNFAQALDQCYGGAPLCLEFLRVAREQTTDDGYNAWLEVRVTSEPLRPPSHRRSGSQPPSGSTPGRDGRP
jgi:hypothetical protein